MFISSAPDKPFQDIREFLARAQREVIIFSPYIKKEALESVIPDEGQSKVIVTSLTVKDIWLGASDLEVYPFCKDNEIKLYLSRRLHLKAFLVDWKEAIIGSANLTQSGLGMVKNFNYELGSLHPTIDAEVALYLRRVIAGAVLMNDKIYEELKAKLEECGPPPVLPLEAATESYSESYLISQLPMTTSVEELFQIYARGLTKHIPKETLNCVLHDIALFQIPLGLNRNEFIERLRLSFFSSPFICALLNFIDEQERYFGEVKLWIQSRCEDVPVPSRRDLTGNIQVLYKWIVELSEGKYCVDRPGHSERIYRLRS